MSDDGDFDFDIDVGGRPLPWQVSLGIIVIALLIWYYTK